MFYAILGSMFVGDLLWWYFAMKLPRRWMRVLAGAFAAMMLVGLLAIVVSRRMVMPLEDFLPRPVHSAILFWHLLLLLPWMVWKLAQSVSRLAKWIAARLSHVERVPESREEHVALSRRDFIRAAAAFTPPMLTIGAAVAGEEQLEDFRIRDLDLELPDLPPALDGLSIAHVTDVHVGRFTRGAVLQRIVDATNQLNADVVAVTGDLINDSLRAMPAAADLVRALRARRMVVMCEGNHDLIDNPREFYRQAETAGLPLLRGETANFDVNGQKVQVLGYPWSRSTTGMANDAAELAKKQDAAAWRMALAHHPHAWDHMQGVPLTLAGHTHGGQLMLNEHTGFGPWLFRYWSGVYRRKNEALIVSNGTGNWFPVRIHAPAEIIHLKLRRKAG